jgi:hypothetical protein
MGSNLLFMDNLMDFGDDTLNSKAGNSLVERATGDCLFFKQETNYHTNLMRVKGDLPQIQAAPSWQSLAPQGN